MAGRNSFPGEWLLKPRKYVPDPRCGEFVHHVWALWLWGVGGVGGTWHMMATCSYIFSFIEKILKNRLKDVHEETFLLKALFCLTLLITFYAGSLRPWTFKMPKKEKPGSPNSDMYLLSRSKRFLTSKQKLNTQGWRALNPFTLWTFDNLINGSLGSGVTISTDTKWNT